jgi:hypothetical protein
MESVPGQVGVTISASEKWLEKSTSLGASTPSAERSSSKRAYVQFETPNPVIAPRSTCESSASANDSTGISTSSRCSVNESSVSTPSSVRARSTSAFMCDGSQ